MHTLGRVSGACVATTSWTPHTKAMAASVNCERTQKIGRYEVSYFSVVPKLLPSFSVAGQGISLRTRLMYWKVDLFPDLWSLITRSMEGGGLGDSVMCLTSSSKQKGGNV